MRVRAHDRGGFTLLEVMIALGILVVTLGILIEAQGTAAEMTWEADRMIVATNLAQEKMAEVRALMEHEGFQDDEIYEEGEFDDFGDEALNVEMRELEDFHYEYLVTELDLGLAGDLAALQANFGDMLGPGPDGAPAPMPDLSSFGISEDMLIEMLQPFIRELRVRVWWGEDSEEAEEYGDEVVITTHVINPQGNLLGAAGLRGAGGAGGNPFGGAGGANPFGGGAGNPFGGGAGGNPFGGAGGGARGGGAMGNPFGGGGAANPFGGGGGGRRGGRR
jgi:prepilin-type N-terminal cleavage/methylation domain-containing protein